ncbi:hypothetical protein Pelo_14218 [Pelomyxa schiedti]|nr:hypothetical protein Pelo_14218 [Pelomyxa schiedti]
MGEMRHHFQAYLEDPIVQEMNIYSYGNRTPAAKLQGGHFRSAKSSESIIGTLMELEAYTKDARRTGVGLTQATEIKTFKLHKSSLEFQ